MPNAAANEIKADDFTNRRSVIRRNFRLSYSTIYLGCLPQKSQQSAMEVQVSRLRYMRDLPSGAVQVSALRQALTLLTTFHIISSIASALSPRRLFVKAAQQNRLEVRTSTAVVPAKSPPCHQWPFSFTFHPRA